MARSEIGRPSIDPKNMLPELQIGDCFDIRSEKHFAGKCACYA